MQKNIKKAAILTAGIVFLTLGLLGLVLPFLQGILFLAIGLILVSFSSPKIRLWINKHTAKYPHLSSVIGKVETWITKFIG
ncbi:hypothetical protein A2738_01010 [Candidatus Nomurabacteria bacterium RIFCSPHIGHO2_01_FULL_42_15]|uniref:DUF454 domain-containing protein n=1 Tax=Candidatus Nomurabacteria bacterium RIFCSPHIGHO2_01_FULL_42_15 TaxID=1801742 RepID=A0A1F6VFM5_9BACT|nr:MAG: hypothetical protein A2738_01010 [Candidatus Nomurabacteria bacterium RIFCSPHIGHO2_01_FULL_42_15]OGI93128.1 MAG: hypothetical protein A3A99_01160 [Candidatus Nomurabacteria bacterium RIFCSPLOWO2_01_FULL_41_18]